MLVVLQPLLLLRISRSLGFQILCPLGLIIVGRQGVAGVVVVVIPRLVRIRPRGFIIRVGLIGIFNRLFRVSQPGRFRGEGLLHLAGVHVDPPVVEGIAVLAPAEGDIQSVVSGEDKVGADILVHGLDHRVARLPQDLGQGAAALAGGAGGAVDGGHLRQGILQILQDALDIGPCGVELIIGIGGVGQLAVGLIPVPAQAEGLGSAGGVLGVAVEIALGEHLVPCVRQLVGVVHQVVFIGVHHHVCGNAKAHLSLPPYLIVPLISLSSMESRVVIS